MNCIPFYKNWYGEHGLDESSIKSPEDIAKIPTLTKEMVRENHEDFVWPSISKKKIFVSRTGGTTGRPLPVSFEKSNCVMYRAFNDEIWKRFGYKPFDFKVILGPSEHLKLLRGIYQHFNPINNFLCLDKHHLNQEIMQKYIEVFEKKRPKFLFGHPSVIFIFSQIIRELKASVPQLAGVLCHSQKLLAGQREIIEEVFGCRVFTQYGLAEKVILAAECEYSQDYHIVPEYGLTELLDSEDKVIESPNVVGELVGTGFYNKIMPLIRYRTADLAAYRENQTCKCDRPHTLLSSLIGRTQDFLVRADGSLKGTSPGIPPFFIFSEYCRGFQFVQEVPGKVEIRVIPKSDNPSGYIEIIHRELKEKYFGSIDIKIIETRSLEKSATGKPKFLIQKLKTPRDQEESVTYSE